MRLVTIYASSSSVYGLNEDVPFHEGQNVDHPGSLVQRRRRMNLLRIATAICLNSTTGLRFFTVYGPWAGQIWPCLNLQRR